MSNFRRTLLSGSIYGASRHGGACAAQVEASAGGGLPQERPPQTSSRKYAGGRSSRRNPCRISSQDDDCQSSSWAERGEAWEATAFLPSYRTKNGNDSDTTKNPARDVPDETGKDERRVNYQATRPAGRRLDRRSSFFRYLPSSVTLER